MLAIALTVAAMLGAACHRDEPTPAPSAPVAPIVERELPADLSIELERTKCYGTCPSYVVKIGATGAVEWEGRDYVDVEGRQTTQVSIESVRALATQFDAMGFAKLHDNYRVAVTDVPWATITLRSAGATKSISLMGEDLVRQNEGMVIVYDNKSEGGELPMDFDQEAQERAKYGPTFLALDDLATAIDTAANTAQWIGTGQKKRHR